MIKKSIDERTADIEKAKVRGLLFIGYLMIILGVLMIILNTYFRFSILGVTLGLSGIVYGVTRLLKTKEYFMQRNNNVST